MLGPAIKGTVMALAFLTVVSVGNVWMVIKFHRRDDSPRLKDVPHPPIRYPDDDDAEFRRLGEDDLDVNASLGQPPINLETIPGLRLYLRHYYDAAEPHLAVQSEIEGVDAQLERVVKLQRRLDTLLAVNHTGSIAARPLMDKIVDQVALNVRWLINYQIAGGNAAFMGKAQTVVACNNRLLGSAEGMLMDVADYINGGELNFDWLERKIDSYRNTIRTITLTSYSDIGLDYGSQAKKEA